MKMRLLTGLIAAACFSQAAFADTVLSDGAVSNLTTATADVEFNQPITLENTLTPVAGLKAGQPLPAGDSSLVIANGKLAIKDSGVTARLALKFMEADTFLSTYAQGHEGDDNYVLQYMPVPNDATLQNLASTYDAFYAGDGNYVVTPTEENQLDYRVVAYSETAGKVKPGKYTISVTGAVYTP